MEKILLAGGGHSHIQVLKRLKEEPFKEAEITLISPSRYQYAPDLFPGYAEGIYNEQEIRQDLQELAEESGVNWMEGAVLSVDPMQKLALTANGDILDFDIISFNIGSMTKGTDELPFSEDIYTIKPNYQFTNAIDSVRDAEKLVIAGGNASAVEIASTLHSWRLKQEIHTPITLITGNRTLSDMDDNITKKISHFLRKKGMRLHIDEDIQKVTEKSVITRSQGIIFDKLLWLEAPKAPDLFKLSKLPVTDKGYLSIEETLQVKKYPFIFGAGGCADIAGSRPSRNSILPCVKQGNVLYTNIKGFLETGEGELYTDQITNPLVFHLGNKQGFALYKNRSFHGRLPWVLRQFQNKQLIKMISK
ncbi:NAD(P)/FAD-dependent oxidoreductase [Bacillus salacetis]|uniref:NAD(P)/FAD-dependent oxidoreductase n=1 Tax=Bacillus salacetis TaxID=2315464 RepID=UPI003BA046D8